MTEQRNTPAKWSEKHDATTDAARTITDSEGDKRSAKTAALKAQRLDQGEPAAPEAPKKGRKPKDLNASNGG